jgi:hypothetical protein
MTPPIWLDGHGRRRPAQACWTCGREVAPMRLRASDLGRTGWMPPETFLMPDWCGCSTEYRCTENEGINSVIGIVGISYFVR